MGLPERTITSLDLYEFGPVTFPAYEATTAGVRSADLFRVFQQNPQSFLLPQHAGPQATVEGEPIDDSRAEEPPVGRTRAERLALARSIAPTRKDLLT